MRDGEVARKRKGARCAVGPLGAGEAALPTSSSVAKVDASRRSGQPMAAQRPLTSMLAAMMTVNDVGGAVVIRMTFLLVITKSTLASSRYSLSIYIIVNSIM